jgi:hypothetical protein
MIAAPLSLYLDLKPSTKADFEVVANTSLAFIKLIRETAFILDPSLEVRIEFDSGTPGSLSLNSLIRAAKKHASVATLATVVSVVGVQFKQEIITYTMDKILDTMLIGDKPGAQLSDKELDRVANRVAELVQKKAVLPQAQQVYRQLERDTAIHGVGSTSVRGSRPDQIVSRDQFKLRGSQDVLRVANLPDQKKRRVRFKGSLTLISPVLVHDDRRWKFSGPGGEFGAYIDDEAFVDRALSGHVRFCEGSQFSVEMLTTEEFDGKVWTPTERHIVKIGRMRKPLRQASLPLGNPPKKESHKGKK